MSSYRAGFFLWGVMAAGFGGNTSLHAQAQREPAVVLPRVAVNANVPLAKVADYRLREGRWLAAAVAQGGFIYVIGGVGAHGELLTSIERLDVRTGKSEPFAELKFGRRGHRAVLFENRIYVLGGNTDRMLGPNGPTGPQGPVSAPPSARAPDATAAGGFSLLGDADVHGMITAGTNDIDRAEANNQGVFTLETPPEGLDDSVEVVDLASRTVSRAANMPDQRASFACVLRDRKVYVIGGAHPYKHTLSTAYTNSTLIFDLASGRWSSGVPMPTPRDAVGVLIDGGFVVVPGGFDGKKQHDEVEVFNPADGIWRTLAPLCKPVAAHSAAFLDRYLFLFGGYDSPGELIAYNLANRQSETFTLQYTPARYTAAVTLGDNVYVIGGLSVHGDLVLDDVQVYVLQKKPPVGP